MCAAINEIIINVCSTQDVTFASECELYRMFLSLAEGVVILDHARSV